jgi:hypothetical protein
LRADLIKRKSEAFNQTFRNKPESEIYQNIPIPNLLKRHCTDPNLNFITESPIGKIAGLRIQAKGRRGSRSMTFTAGHGRLGAGDHAGSNVDFGMSDFVGKMGSTGIKVTIGYS